MYSSFVSYSASDWIEVSHLRIDAQAMSKASFQTNQIRICVGLRDKQESRFPFELWAYWPRDKPISAKAFVSFVQILNSAERREPSKIANPAGNRSGGVFCRGWSGKLDKKAKRDLGTMNERLLSPAPFEMVRERGVCSSTTTGRVSNSLRFW